MTNLRKFFDERPWLTQRGVAEMAGVNESRLCDYCNGLRVPYDVRKRIVTALGVITGKPITVADIWPEPQEAEA